MMRANKNKARQAVIDAVSQPQLRRPGGTP